MTYWLSAFLRISRMPRPSRFMSIALPKVAVVAAPVTSWSRLVTGTTNASVRVEVLSSGARKATYAVLVEFGANSRPSTFRPVVDLGSLVEEAFRPSALPFDLSQDSRSLSRPV